MYELPSPEELKGKIIIKDRKIGNDDVYSTFTAAEDDDDDSAYDSFRDGPYYSHDQETNEELSEANEEKADFFVDGHMVTEKNDPITAAISENPFYKFVEEGTRIPLQSMAKLSITQNSPFTTEQLPNLDTNQGSDNKEKSSAVFENEEIEDQFEDKEFFNPSSIDSVSSSYDDSYKRKRSSVRRHKTSVSSVRDSENGSKKISVLSMGESENMVG